MLNQLTISELSNLLARREASSVETMRACLARIEQCDSRVHAFISYRPEAALQQAEGADRAIAEGVSFAEKPLLGIPIALKDVLAARAEPLNCGSQILGQFISPYDATVVARLRAVGAVVFGRLNMDEFAMGSSTENSSFGPTRNPWDLERTPGGSSGGSAAAVAADMCLASLGSDTGGSVRQPAAFCGCVGLKPTYGRVSRYGLVAYASSLDQIGPLTKSTADAALVLRVISGHDPMDSTSLPNPVPDYLAELTQEVRGLRLGLPREYLVGGLHPDVKASLDEAVKTLQSLGVEIVEISLPHTEHAIATYYIIATAEASANLARFDGIRYGRRAGGADVLDLYARTRGSGFGSEVKRRIILGTYVLSSGYYDAYYLRAQKVRTLIRRDFLNAFEKVDAIITPTSPTPPFRLGERSADPLEMYLSDIFTISANLAGICGISVPCGFSREPRLPLGLQILGPHLGESTILRLAHAFEHASEWHRHKPSLPG
jgi:aspartyl-tRNA(Asn)/glutamyl-tRNA(Gln) amidotransferase subunit A